MPKTIRLLTTNAKLSKSPDGSKFLVAGLSIAPHGIGGSNVCEGATIGCKSACNLWFAGLTVMSTVRNAMIKRKEFLQTDSPAFYDQLRNEIRAHIKKANKLGLRPLLRLNVASDLNWSHIIREFPEVTFYDYSKVFTRAVENNLPNYHITYSRSEKTPEEQLQTILDASRNIAVVFNVKYHPQTKTLGELPDTFMGRKVVDGDLHDFRLPEVDGKGVVIGIRLKGGTKARQNAIKTGFAVTPERVN
jgi:hypothetical protein